MATRLTDLTEALSIGSDDLLYGVVSGNSRKVSVRTLFAGSNIELRPPQASTSGTAIDFTGIPATAKRITIMFDGVSMTGGGFTVQLGDSGGIETTGYTAINAVIQNAANPNVTAFSSGFTCSSLVAGSIFSGAMVLDLANAATNTWICSMLLSDPTLVRSYSVSGRKSLSAVLDRLRITTGGADTFDLGSISISIE